MNENRNFYSTTRSCFGIEKGYQKRIALPSITPTIDFIIYYYFIRSLVLCGKAVSTRSPPRPPATSQREAIPAGTMTATHVL